MKKESAKIVKKDEVSIMSFSERDEETFTPADTPVHFKSKVPQRSTNMRPQTAAQSRLVG